MSAVDITFKHYMVEFDSGRTAHIGGEDVFEVKDYCKENYSGDRIKTIYLEVFCGEQ